MSPSPNDNSFENLHITFPPPSPRPSPQQPEPEPPKPQPLDLNHTTADSPEPPTMASSIPIEGPPALDAIPEPTYPVSITNGTSFRGYAGIHSHIMLAMNFLTNELLPVTPNSNATCVICNDSLQNPVALPDCGHVFCKECIVAWLNPFDRQAATDVGLQVDFPDWVRGRGGDEGVGDEEGGLEEGDEEEELTAPTSPGEGHGIVDVSNPGVANIFNDLFDRLGERRAPTQEGRPLDHHRVSARPDEEPRVDHPIDPASDEPVVNFAEPGTAVNTVESYSQVESLGYLDHYQRTGDDDPFFVGPDGAMAGVNGEEDGFWDDRQYDDGDDSILQPGPNTCPLCRKPTFVRPKNGEKLAALETRIRVWDEAYKYFGYELDQSERSFRDVAVGFIRMVRLPGALSTVGKNPHDENEGLPVLGLIRMLEDALGSIGGIQEDRAAREYIKGWSEERLERMIQWAQSVKWNVNDLPKWFGRGEYPQDMKELEDRPYGFCQETYDEMERVRVKEIAQRSEWAKAQGAD